MLQFAEQLPDVQIVVPLARQLSWSHFTILIPIKDQEARLFYANLAAEGALGKRELRKQIGTKTFERSSIANLQNTVTILPSTTQLGIQTKHFGLLQ